MTERDYSNVTPVSHSGVDFRSATEAAWANVFNRNGIRWEYEPIAFELPSGWYLPDFYLVKAQQWVEIKPTYPTREEILRLAQLNDRVASTAFIWGVPSACTMGDMKFFESSYIKDGVEHSLGRGWGPDEGASLYRCGTCGAEQVAFKSNPCHNPLCKAYDMRDNGGRYCEYPKS